MSVELENCKNYLGKYTKVNFNNVRLGKQA